MERNLTKKAERIKDKERLSTVITNKMVIVFLALGQLSDDDDHADQRKRDEDRRPFIMVPIVVEPAHEFALHGDLSRLVLARAGKVDLVRLALFVFHVFASFRLDVSIIADFSRKSRAQPDFSQFIYAKEAPRIQNAFGAPLIKNYSLVPKVSKTGSPEQV